MALRGERFNIDLPEALSGINGDDAHDDEIVREQQDSAPSVVPVKDVLERSAGSSKAPLAPTQKNSKGFPEHKKRFTSSKFKQSRTDPSQRLDDAASYVGQQPQEQVVADRAHVPIHDDEQASIDRENKQRLSSMSDSDIEKERRELLEHLSPSLIERLLKRSTIEDMHTVQKDAKTDSQRDGTSKPPVAVADVKRPASSAPEKKVQFADSSDEPAEAVKPAEHSHHISSSDNVNPEDVPSIHFPPAPQPDLDPSSPNFLNDLHTKYFPSLPADPSKLAWMQPSSTTTYSPAASTVQIPDLRFSFAGSLITPRQAKRIAVTEGLHHHEEAADSAGYTVPELARLAHSAVAAQRCIAFQTLGRILYRLGTGEFGDADEQIPEGLWLCVRDGAVIETLERAAKEEGHTSAKVYATEALWLWQKGGGHRVRAE